MLNSQKKNRGFTLTELAIVLSVFGAIIGAIWYAASSVHEAQKENDAITEIRTISHNMNSLFAGQKLQSATDNMTNAMIAAQTVPNSYVDSVHSTPPNAAVDNPWDNGVPDVGGVHANRGVEIYLRPAATYANIYRIALYNETLQGCIAIVNAMTNCQSGQSDCPIQAYSNWANTPLYVNGTLTALPANTGWSGIATTTAIYNMCNANTYPGNATTANSVEFDFAP